MIVLPHVKQYKAAFCKKNTLFVLRKLARIAVTSTRTRGGCCNAAFHTCTDNSGHTTRMAP